MGNQLQARHGN